MGSLTEKKTLRRVVLEAENVIGRSNRCNVRADASLVSSVHATLRFTPQGWELKDLGSTNGSFVNGARLDAGQVRKISQGDDVAFGGMENAWTFTEDSPPQPMAISEDGEFVLSQGEPIALPSPEEPTITLYRDHHGCWRLEGPDNVSKVVTNGDGFAVAGRQWHFSCPETVLRTSAALSRDIRTAVLKFRVSSDEEYVELSVHAGGEQLQLGGRAHNYLLLTLARRRTQDMKAGLSEAEAGWMYHDELAKALATSPEHLNVDIFRIRKHFAQHFPNAAEIIERRARSGKLRIGVSNLEVGSFVT